MGFKKAFAILIASVQAASALASGEGQILHFQQITNLESLPAEMIVEQIQLQSRRILESRPIDEKIHASLLSVCRAEMSAPSAEIAKALIPLLSEEYGKTLHSSCRSKGGCFVAAWSGDISLIQDCAKAADRHLADSRLSAEERRQLKRELLRALIPGTAYDFDKKARREIAGVLVHKIVHEAYPEIPFRDDARKVKGKLAQLIDLTAESGFVDKLETRLEAASQALRELGLAR